MCFWSPSASRRGVSGGRGSVAAMARAYTCTSACDNIYNATYTMHVGVSNGEGAELDAHTSSFPSNVFTE